MKYLFIEKYIRTLSNDQKSRLEIYDSFCPYLGRRISKIGQKAYLSVTSIWGGISLSPLAERTKAVWISLGKKSFTFWKRFKTVFIRTKRKSSSSSVMSLTSRPAAH